MKIPSRPLWQRGVGGYFLANYSAKTPAIPEWTEIVMLTSQAGALE